MNEKKKILITCFDSFWLHKQNASKLVAINLCEKLLKNTKWDLKDNAPLVLSIDNYNEPLTKEINTQNYDYIV